MDVLLIQIQGLNRSGCSGQHKKLAEERRRLEAQQAESQQMMAELLKLKNELSGKESTTMEPQEQSVDEKPQSMV